jgi:hypothetical protein
MMEPKMKPKQKRRSLVGTAFKRAKHSSIKLDVIKPEIGIGGSTGAVVPEFP